MGLLMSDAILIDPMFDDTAWIELRAWSYEVDRMRDDTEHAPAERPD